jgi:hypothetical protein
MAAEVVLHIPRAGLKRLRKNSLWPRLVRVLYQRMTSVMPQLPQNQRGLQLPLDDLREDCPSTALFPQHVKPNPSAVIALERFA